MNRERNIFGQPHGDEAFNQLERGIIRDLAHNRFQDERTIKNKIRSALRAAGVPVVGATAMGAMYSAIKNFKSHKRGGDDFTTPQKKLRSEPPNISGKKRPADKAVQQEAKRVKAGEQPLALPNLTATEQAEVMSNPIGSGNDAGLTETPVDDVVNVMRGPRNYQYASLPYYYDRYVQETTYWNSQWTWRMTSPYDVSVEAALADINAGAGLTNVPVPVVLDTSDASAQKARWFDFYADQYKYYHVVSCRWHLTLENMSTEPIWVHSYYSNEVDRPPIASNQDMLMWPDTESHYVGAQANAITTAGRVETSNLIPNVSNDETQAQASTDPNFESTNMVVSRGVSPILQLSGEYRPGDYDREIRLDSDVENWTLTSTNPRLAERHTFRVRPQWDAQPPGAGNTANYTRSISYRFVYRAEFLVEFKELHDNLKYPVNQQPLRVAIQFGQGTL